MPDSQFGCLAFLFVSAVPGNLYGHSVVSAVHALKRCQGERSGLAPSGQCSSGIDGRSSSGGGSSYSIGLIANLAGSVRLTMASPTRASGTVLLRNTSDCTLKTQARVGINRREPKRFL